MDVLKTIKNYALLIFFSVFFGIFLGISIAGGNAAFDLIEKEKEQKQCTA